MRGAAPLAVLALLAPACGGDEGPSPETYRRQADDICAEARVRTAPVAERLARQARSLSASGAAAAGETARELERIASEEVAQLRALERPGDDEEEIEAFLGPAERLVGAIGRAADALENRQMVAALAVVQEAQGLARDAEAAAADLGLDRCREFVALVPS